MVEMHLSAVRVELPANVPILLLQEASGDRTLPIYIGRQEAESIAGALQGVVTKRPMTHDLMRDILSELGTVLDHVVITELKEQTFFAELRLRRGSANYVVSARPSDAIALAVRTGATIYAEEALLDAEGIVISPRDDPDEGADGDELVAQFHEFLEGIRPEDFDK
ncbi:MAG TPA: bifunctional nuclease family protein [Acidimicrobiales bacterium]|nr:bifunctional nuclease family protein [Acidimicrobiales bacterium]